jgi:hypothetical protein
MKHIKLWNKPGQQWDNRVTQHRGSNTKKKQWDGANLDNNGTNKPGRPNKDTYYSYTKNTMEKMQKQKTTTER